MVVYCIGSSRDLLGDYDFNPFVDEELDYDENMEDLPLADSAAEASPKEEGEEDDDDDEEEDKDEDQSKPSWLHLMQPHLQSCVHLQLQVIRSCWRSAQLQSLHHPKTLAKVCDEGRGPGSLSLVLLQFPLRTSAAAVILGSKRS